jgi:hypothetical protein
VSTVPLRYALASAVAAMVATVLGMALHFGIDEPGATLTGAGFGMSFTLYSALLAMPFGLLLGLLRPRVGRSSFLLLATAAGVVSGILFGLWVLGDGHFFSRSVVATMGCTWALVAFGMASLIRRSPNTSLERTREG